MPKLTRLQSGTRLTPRRNDGVALFLVLGFLAAMTIMVGTFLEGVRFALAQERAASNELVVRNLAQAGIDSAIGALLEDAGAYEGESDVTLGEGRYTVRLKHEADSNAFRIDSIGEIEDSGRVLHSFRLRARVVIEDGRLVSIAQTVPGSKRRET